MDIAEAITTDYLEFDPSTRVSKLMGAFKEHGSKALLIGSGDDVAGIVTRKQLVSSQHNPNEKARNLMRDDVPQIDVRDDIREVSRLMVESDLNLLPVYDGESFEGIVTARSIVRAVQPNLDALDVSDVYTQDLIAVDPDTTLGAVINTLRTHGISRVPVIEETGESGRPETTERTSGDTEIEGGPTPRDAVGMASYYDIIDFIVRETSRMEGGSTAGFDGHGGSGSRGNYRTHTGYGDRGGDEDRLLDLPVGNVMSSPVQVTGPTTPLGEAAGEMLDNEYTSLVVQLPEEGPDGILTLTDVLRSLTWTPEEETRLQVFGMNLLTDLSREDVAAMIEEVDGKYEEMDVIEAYVVLQNHRERQRGMPLIRATIRLFTNKGRFAGTGEEYGAAPAIRAARDRLERTVLDDKSHTIEERRSPGTREEAEHLVGWWLET